MGGKASAVPAGWARSERGTDKDTLDQQPARAAMSMSKPASRYRARSAIGSELRRHRPSAARRKSLSPSNALPALLATWTLPARIKNQQPVPASARHAHVTSRARPLSALNADPSGPSCESDVGSGARLGGVSATTKWSDSTWDAGTQQEVDGRVPLSGRAPTRVQQAPAARWRRRAAAAVICAASAGAGACEDSSAPRAALLVGPQDGGVCGVTELVATKHYKPTSTEDASANFTPAQRVVVPPELTVQQGNAGVVRATWWARDGVVNP